MTVDELIDILRKCDSDYEVVIEKNVFVEKRLTHSIYETVTHALNSVEIDDLTGTVIINDET